MEINEKAKVLFGRKHKNSFKSDLPFLALLLPAMIVTLIFAYLPMVGLVLAFEDFDMFKGYLSPLTDHFGFGHFITIFSEPSIFEAIWNTFYLNLLGLVINFPAPLIFALLLDEVTRKGFKRTVQTISYLPHFVSWVVAANLIFVTFSPDSGIVNEVLLALGIIDHPVSFMGMPQIFWLMVALADVWKSAGYNAIVYLAAMTSIDPSLYESADIDGAGRFQIMWHITVPGILETYFVLLLLSIANFISNGMEQYFVFQNAMNRNKIEVLDLYVYNIGLGGGSFSYATAVSILKSVVSLTLLFVANNLSRLVRGNTIL